MHTYYIVSTDEARCWTGREWAANRSGAAAIYLSAREAAHVAFSTAAPDRRFKVIEVSILSGMERVMVPS
jgi:hypothetical protein